MSGPVVSRAITANGAVVAPAVLAQLKALRRLVGNTPLLAVDVRYRGEPRRVYAKYSRSA